jgi:hypothetical protein
VVSLLEPTAGYVYRDPEKGLSYTNLLDQMLDVVMAAMCRASHGGVGLVLAETRWPTAGDLDQFDADVQNATTYNWNLAQHRVHHRLVDWLSTRRGRTTLQWPWRRRRRP